MIERHRGDSNQFTLLEVSANIALIEFDCYGNQLTTLDVSLNTALAYLYCDNNCLHLSDLFIASEILESNSYIGFRRLGTQNLLPQTANIGEILFASEAEFNGIFTEYSDITKNGSSAVSPSDYTITNGTITFNTSGNYSVTMTNAAIISSPTHPAKVLAEIEVLQFHNEKKVAFYANNVYYQNLPDTTFCASNVNFITEISGGKLHLEQGHIKWYIDGVLQTLLTDKLEWVKTFSIDKFYNIQIEVRFEDNETYIAAATLKIKLCPFDCPNKLIDHENNIYSVIHLVGLCWSSNMKNRTYSDGTTISFARAYHSLNSQDTIQNISDFSLLYDWYSATRALHTTHVQGICPNGWRLPTSAELVLLNTYSADDLKNQSYWLQPNSYTNSTGFDSRGAGYYNSVTQRFENLLGYTAYWSSDDPTANSGIAAQFNYFCNQAEIVEIRLADAISVRCVLE